MKKKTKTTKRIDTPQSCILGYSRSCSGRLTFFVHFDIQRAFNADSPRETSFVGDSRVNHHLILSTDWKAQEEFCTEKVTMWFYGLLEHWNTSIVRLREKTKLLTSNFTDCILRQKNQQDLDQEISTIFDRFHFVHNFILGTHFCKITTHQVLWK